MLSILLLSCAKVTPNSIQPMASVETLEIIDLSKEFDGLSDTEWTYQLLKWTIPSQQSVELHPNSGWKILDGEWDVANNGFVNSTLQLSNMGTNTAHILVATIQNSSNYDIPALDVQKTIDEEIATTGIEMKDTWTKPLVDFPLDKSMRFRWVELEANGRVGKHTHDGRPSLAYVIEGDLVEHRGDGDQSRGSHDSVAERNGLTHWWQNGDDRASIVVFDIVD